MTQEDPALVRAREHVTEVRDFYYHLMVYVLVNAMLIIIDRSGGANNGFMGLDFAHWVILGWGFGVAGHAISVFYGDYRVQQVYEKDKERRSGGNQ